MSYRTLATAQARCFGSAIAGSRLHKSTALGRRGEPGHPVVRARHSTKDGCCTTRRPSTTSTARGAAAPPAPRACAALAVIGKKNRPLAFRVYDASSDAYLRNLILCSLDVVDECAQAQENSRDEFLGVATTVDGRKLYASRTATGVTLCARCWTRRPASRRRTSGPASRTRKAARAKCLTNPFFKLDGGRDHIPVFAARVDEAVRLRLESARRARAALLLQRPTRATNASPGK